MGVAMIKCPKTGKFVDAGITLDRATYSAIQMSGNATRCPECGETHVWDKKDVHWIEEQAGPRLC